MNETTKENDRKETTKREAILIDQKNYPADRAVFLGCWSSLRGMEKENRTFVATRVEL